MNWIKSNFWEIARSPLLSRTGALLALIHLITYFFWLDHSHLFGANSGRPLLCWSFWTSCQDTNLMPANLLPMLLTTLLVSSCIAIFLFIWRRVLGLAWFCLFLSTSIYVFFYLYDSSLATDAGTLFLILSIGFLFIPNKPFLVRSLVFLFFIASAYKLWSVDWLSGSTLIGVFPLPPKGNEWVAAMTLVAYLTLPILLISPIPQRLAIGWGILSVLHLFYFYFERTLGALTLLLVLLYFLFDYFEKRRLERESLYQSYEHPEPSRLWPAIISLIFILAQTKLLMNAPAADVLKLTGPAQSSQCRHVTFLQKDELNQDLSDDHPKGLAKGLECHPWLNFNYVRSLCQKYAVEGGNNTINHQFMVRRLGDKNYRTLFADVDFCRPNLSFATAKGGAR